ncbi:hypothetical protein CNMCM8980_000405 [Aspergillus fumigatiaffinis]|jgi:uncharacterized oxidoreductase|uniref:Uncharacterized protein n=1 Tax=Aspergillus fumigatiaffinis TaxID=340414 RepID=A0A8H4MD65_9EURO|nr:hypothetical protein CNMCM6457_004549 [Aspergillus fumigatiaffinis]KAF4242077.1 hypothetical protein CNMCM6805_003192 [Aspergillus fumigatiaffinis]KAF4250575.1 hypothetical protein CNMCM8980_000405 [Aspergillus fumigatiaffinis]
MATLQTILIIGATSGIGEELARRYHANGKKVIISGRRTERLDALTAELPGLGSLQMDVKNLAALPSKMDEAFARYPDIDAVIINAGIQRLLDFNTTDVSAAQYPTTDAITDEITTNLAGPTVLARCIIEHFKASRSNQPCLLAFVTSGLALVPAAMFPVYCATKSALHSFTVLLRNQLKDTSISVVEIVPPYVETELDKDHVDELARRMGGTRPQAMPVKQFVDQVVLGLEVTDENGKIQKYVADGFPRAAVDAWVGAIGPMAKIVHTEL